MRKEGVNPIRAVDALGDTHFYDQTGQREGI